MDLRLGGEVLASDGRCGILRHVVVDPKDRTVQALVVGTPSGDVVVPIDRVRAEEGGRPKVAATRDEVAAMPPFVSVDFCLPPAEEPGRCNQIWPVVPATLEGEASAVPLRVEHVALEPGEIPLERGMPVRCRDGDCGTLEEVMADPETGRISAVLMTRGKLFAGSLLIPVSWIDRVDQGAVFLRVTRDQVDKLARSIARGEWKGDGGHETRTPGPTSVYIDIEPGGEL